MFKKLLSFFVVLFVASGTTSCTPSVSKSLNIAKRVAQVGACSIISVASVGAGLVGAKLLILTRDPEFRSYYRYPNTTAIMFELCGVAMLMGSYEVIKKYSTKAKVAYNGDNQDSKQAFKEDVYVKKNIVTCSSFSWNE